MNNLVLSSEWSCIRLANEIQEVRRKNRVLLLKFKQWLRRKNTRENVISNHAKNCDFFLNEFLVHLDISSANEGYSKINMFLGYWFIIKAIWSTPAAIESNAVSLEMFYTFLYEKGDITRENLETLTKTIQSEKPKWVASMRWYAKHGNDALQWSG